MWRTIMRFAIVTLFWCGITAAATPVLGQSMAGLIAGFGASATFAAWALAITTRNRRQVEHVVPDVAEEERRQASV